MRQGDTMTDQDTCSRLDLHVFGKSNTWTSESPSVPALVLHLIRLGTREYNRPLNECATYRTRQGRKQLFEVGWEEEKPRNQGEETAQVFGGQDLFRPGRGRSALGSSTRTGRQGCSGWPVAARHTYGSRVQPRPALSGQPTNEAVNIRKNDWTGVESRASVPSPPPPFPPPFPPPHRWALFSCW